MLSVLTGRYIMGVLVLEDDLFEGEEREEKRPEAHVGETNKTAERKQARKQGRDVALQPLSPLAWASLHRLRRLPRRQAGRRGSRTIYLIREWPSETCTCR